MLTNEERQILRNMGEEERYINEIERDLKYLRLTLVDEALNTHKKISRETAKSLLGLKDYLSGLDRAMFHYSAVRPIADSNHSVYFDCSGRFDE